MGFWFPSLHLGFTAPVPSYCRSSPIFYVEALVVLAALRHAPRWLSRGGRLAIFTDNFVWLFTPKCLYVSRFFLECLNPLVVS